MNTRKIVSTILVIIWMFTIFCFSQQRGTESSNTSKSVSIIIINILDIKGKITKEQKEEVLKVMESYIRKIAHYTIYLVGGILIANCINTFINKEKTVIKSSTIIGVLYAVSDEIHQLMVLGRSGSIKDVIIDSIGILTGIALFLLAKKIIKIVLAKFRKAKEVE